MTADPNEDAVWRVLQSRDHTLARLRLDEDNELAALREKNAELLAVIADLKLRLADPSRPPEIAGERAPDGRSAASGCPADPSRSLE